jgi:negative regulator of sigma E activity
MNNIQDSLTPNGTHATTTEELIVQYLDGELVRRELETVLFDRLLHSEDARALLRDYLVMRGAIRQSRSDERFQLSDDLDARTRARIEQMFETISADEVPSGFLDDKPAISTTATTRSLKRWVLRPSIAALALLLAVGTTWFVTRSTDSNRSTVSPRGEMAQVLPNPVQPAPIPTATTQPANQPAVIPAKQTSSNNVAHAPARIRTQSFAQNAPSVQPAIGQPKAVEPSAGQEQAADPNDVMLFPRYTKAINAAEKHEVVITSKDRL